MRYIIATVFALLVASAVQAQTIPSVAGTTWCVHASWSSHLFSWVFADSGRYKDTDGPSGSWVQAGPSLTLTSDGGFTYRATLTRDLGNGAVFRTDDGAAAGSFYVERIAADTSATCQAAGPNGSSR